MEWIRVGLVAALFQMWQMQLGEGAMRGALYSGMFSGLVLTLLMVK